MLKKALCSFVFIFILQSLFCQELTLLDANKRKWVAGQKKSGYGFDYKFRLQLDKNLKQFELKGVWIDSLFYEGSVYKNYIEVPPKTNLKKKEEILIKVTVRYIPNDKEEYIPNNIKPFEKMPLIKNKNYEALIFYTYKGQKRYHIVSSIETLKPMFMP